MLHARRRTLGHSHRRGVHAGWGTTGTTFGAHHLGGPFLQSNDTTAAWMGGALNASCAWLYNQNVTDPNSGLSTYQRAFQCAYGMQARRAPDLHATCMRPRSMSKSRTEHNFWVIHMGHKIQKAVMACTQLAHRRMGAHEHL